MNKTEFVEAMAKKTAETKKLAEESLNAIVDSITEALASGDKIQLVGFGTFEVIPASKAPKFKAGKALKDIVNK